MIFYGGIYMRYKPLPIGIDNFEEIIKREYYYVDKTLLMKQLLDTMSEVTLFTRPRRFGKSLNLSMLQYFFEYREEEKTHLFKELKIASAGERYQEHRGKYPVIMLNFKGAKYADFEVSYYAICENIANEFKRHQSVLQSPVFLEKEKERYEMIQNQEAPYKVMVSSVKFLTECLEKAYGEKVILLLDEYDVPLENSYFHGFYQEMVEFVRGILSNALKTNTSLFMAVLTGCLRISKESIFTGLNNLKIVSIENKAYGEYFGFTEEEVDDMLAYYHRTHQKQVVKDWYNGYLFGNTQVYNPWSLVNYMDSLQADENEVPKPYWSNTSSNGIIKEFIERIDLEGKMELEILMAGGSIEKAIHEDITYEDIYLNMDNLWNFLYFTGYLKKVSERFEVDTSYVTLQIPNVEVGSIYKRQIKEWTRVQMAQTDGWKLYEATVNGDVQTMEVELKKVLLESISYYDTNHPSGDLEAFYHGIMLGLYRGMKQYIPLSNRESGNGRPDLIIKSPSFEGKAFVMEFKIAKSPTALEVAAKEALAQIERQDYLTGLLVEGYTEISVYGIGFYKKSCKVLTIPR